MIFYSAMAAQTTPPADSSSSTNNRAAQHSSRQPDVSAANQNMNALREEDIMVTLDYQPPPDSSYYVETSAPRQAHSSSNRRDSRSHQNDYTQQQGRLRRQRRQHDENFLRFYSKHWFGQCIAALITGMIFMTIGIVFVSTDITSPYIGVMFMLVSLPSFFMSLHMVRTRIRQQRLRRIYLERQRRRMARRRRRRRAGNDWHRSNALPYSDLPPSYENFGFTDHEHVSGDQTLENDATSMGSLSDISEGPPPSYDNEWDKESLEDIGTENEEDEQTANPAEKNVSTTVASTETGSQVPTCSHLNQT